MAARKLTDHDPMLLAIIAGGFVWFVFDSFFFGMLAGFIAYVMADKSQKEKEDS